MRTLHMKLMLAFCVIVSLTLLLSCSDENQNEMEPIPPIGVSIEPATLSLVKGGSSTLTATVLPENSTNKKITWASNNRSVAEVSYTGVVSAISVGEAVISATTVTGQKSGNCTVTVTLQAVPVTNITIKQQTLNLVANGKTESLSTVFTPSSATNKKVTWSSSDETVAIVDELGCVTPLQEGQTTVTVTTDDGAKTAKCVVTVAKEIIYVKEITIKTPPFSLVEGGITYTIEPIFTPENATDKSIKWSSSDKTVATIDEFGAITPIKKGKTTITVVSKDTYGMRATCDIIVVTSNIKTYEVQMGGNSYVTEYRSGATVDNTKGLIDWNDGKSVISTYFYLHTPGYFDLKIKAKGKSTIKATCGDETYNAKINSNNFTTVNIGTFTAKTPGYVRVDLQGVESQNSRFGEVEALVVEAEGEMSYVNDPKMNYWGRRGPSVHMGYTLPKDDIEWFYNEITVPKEGETISSYYMVAGYGEGYFGMQYNSTTERRILFSVWSPYETDKPGDIPLEYQIVLKRKGPDVHIGEFGNEGSGGQSYLKYNWKAGETYKFLMQVHPDGKGNTIYTAYFFATDDNEWRLIASFLRPKTSTWYTNAHSFLENFSPNQGYLSREVSYSNQWSLSNSGTWTRLTNGKFTNDGTAAAGLRLDYQGGVLDNGSFYLKMGGFFNESTTAGTEYVSNSNGTKPDIDFEHLKTLGETIQ